MALNLSTVCECWQAVPWGAVGNAFLIARSVCKHGCSYSCFVYLLHKLVHLFHVPFIWLESVHLRSNATAFAEKPQMSRGWPINYNQVHLPVRWLWNVNTVFFYNLAVKSCEKRWSSYQWVIKSCLSVLQAVFLPFPCSTHLIQKMGSSWSSAETW